MKKEEKINVQSVQLPLPEGKGGLSPDYYSTITYLSALEASPDRKKLAWVQSQIQPDENRSIQDIYILEDDSSRRLTASGDVGNYIWHSDDELLFQSESRNDAPANNIKEKQVWYLLSLQGGEAVKHLTFDKPVQKLVPLGEDSYLCAIQEDAHWPIEAPFQLRKEVDEKRAAYRWIDHLPFYLNGMGWRDHSITRLYHYDKAKDDLKLLSDKDLSIGHFDLNEEKTKVVYTGMVRKQKMGFKPALFELDLESGETKTLVEEGKYQLALPFYWDEDIAILATDGAELGINQNYRLALVEDDLRYITDELNVGNALGTDLRQGGNRTHRVIDGKLYMTMTRSNRAVLEVFEKDGSKRSAVQDVVSVEGFDITDDLYVSAFQAAQPVNLFRLPQETLAERLAVTPGDYPIDTLCERPLEDKDLAEVIVLNEDPNAKAAQRLTYESRGVPMEGWVILPDDYSQEGKHPAIFDVHGGPKTIYGPGLYHEMQYWASQGYVVFFTNPHGSAGRGDAFSDIRGLYGSIDFEDLMTFMDVVLEAYPGIDPERVGMTGGSYGGFMANWMLTHTDRFAAIATQRSICNWVSFYGTSDIGYYFATDQNGVTIEDENFWEKLWDHSPIKYIDRAKTPTLIVHSALDYRCPVEQGYQLYNALIDREVPTALLLFHEENHDLSRTGKPQSRRQRLAAITQWMNHYLKGEPLLDQATINQSLVKEREDHVDH